MKRLPRKPRLVSEINITPFTDVILVILVIFMVATPLMYQSNFKLSLASAKNKNQLTGPSKVNIAVNNNGVIYLEKKAVTVAELKNEAQLLQTKNQDIAVLLHADQAVQFKHVASVLDVLDGLNIKNINIAVDAER